MLIISETLITVHISGKLISLLAFFTCLHVNVTTLNLDLCHFKSAMEMLCPIWQDCTLK